MVGHVTPEAAAGGTLAFVQDGDVVTIDQRNAELNVALTEDEVDRRRAEFESGDRAPLAKSEGAKGLLAKYRAQVRSAHFGAVTH